MEVKEKSKKRELIKTIAIVFLAVLLVLTFFSQTIMNHSLPEVATQVDPLRVREGWGQGGAGGPAVCAGGR